jgi:hypothetical protein
VENVLADGREDGRGCESLFSVDVALGKLRSSCDVKCKYELTGVRMMINFHKLSRPID